MPKADARSNTQLPRRALLAAPVAALPLVAAAKSDIVSAPVGANGDAALIRAWNDFLTATKAIDRIPMELGDAACEPFHELIWNAVDGLLSIPATTHQGVAIKLRWLWQRMLESDEAYQVVVYGAPMTPDLLEDSRSRLLWNLIGEVEQMGAGI